MTPRKLLAMLEENFTAKDLLLVIEVTATVASEFENEDGPSYQYWPKNVRDSFRDQCLQRIYAEKCSILNRRKIITTDGH